ncbi:Short-chain dehydrogenase reductase 3c [Spatholobus suberectus]|nr:Short-chain dehydrogenase reductase 3c [Spatholobus suberectus]
MLDFDLNEFDNTMVVNVCNAVSGIKHATRVMVARKTCGSIICTVSMVNSFARCTGHDYTVSKHGLVGLVRSAYSELRAYGIKVNSVSPFCSCHASYLWSTRYGAYSS